MGLKSGSRDAGLDETEEPDEQQPTEDQSNADKVTQAESETVRADPTLTESVRETSESTDSEPTNGRPTMSSIPYKLRRDKVNEGREQVPFFLREEVIDTEVDLQNTLEETLGEHVYKSDYREAAMVVAQRNPELVAEVLREWGYDLDAI